jgi:hypothetical protein
MPYETFELRFTDCEHVLNVPLIHSTHRVTCYVCEPEMRDVPAKGKCPKCEDAEAKPNHECSMLP